MKHSDFYIGLEFMTGKPARWRCTDVGTRTIAAIELTIDDPDWWAYKGPTYGTTEIVFDEDDFPGCSPVDE